jgi:hypothetical protein
MAPNGAGILSVEDCTASIIHSASSFAVIATTADAPTSLMRLACASALFNIACPHRRHIIRTSVVKDAWRLATGLRVMGLDVLSQRTGTIGVRPLLEASRSKNSIVTIRQLYFAYSARPVTPSIPGPVGCRTLYLKFGPFQRPILQEFPSFSLRQRDRSVN